MWTEWCNTSSVQCIRFRDIDNTFVLFLIEKSRFSALRVEDTIYLRLRTRTAEVTGSRPEILVNPDYTEIS